MVSAGSVRTLWRSTTASVSGKAERLGRFVRGHSSQVLVSAGLGLVTAGILLRWLDIPLGVTMHSWSLPVFIVGLSTFAPVNYGTVVTALALVAAVALWRSGGRPTVVTGLVGVTCLLVASMFVVETLGANNGLYRQLNLGWQEQRIINRQLRLTPAASQPATFLVFSLDSHWGLVLGSLRLGWLFTVIGGTFLLIASAGEVRAVIARHWRITAAAVSLVVFVVLRGIAANLILSWATLANQQGDFRTANTRLAVAHWLNPAIELGFQYNLDTGRVMSHQGDPRAPLTLLVESDLERAAGNADKQLADLFSAAERAPNNLAITDQLTTIAMQSAVQHRDPAPLIALTRQPYGDRPDVQLTLGRMLYRVGDYQQAIPHLRRVAQLTPDTDAQSVGYTWAAICEMQLHKSSDARHDLLAAVMLDKHYHNITARSLATGLFSLQVVQ